MSRPVAAVVTALSVALWFLVPDIATGQAFWPKDTPKLPMARTWVAQKAKLPRFTPPRTPDGVPDLQGVWSGAGGDNNSFLEEHDFVDVTTPAQESFVSDPPDGNVPYTPWALARRKEMLAGLGRGWPGESSERLHASPGSFCLNVAPVFSFDAQEIVQKPGYVIMLSDDTYRVIPTDGRPAISQNAKFWFGTSRGRWDGDTLVVEVTSLNGRGWFDSTGQFYSENTRMVERWRLTDANTIDYEVTVEDPTIYTRPWTMNFPKRRAGTGPSGPRGSSAVSRLPPAATKDQYANELWETACHEGNHESVAGIRALGYKWFSGVTPPK
ncbi:MAG: hypothetical protein ACRD3C_18575 [Vicinamibacterales bacterium]